MLEYLHFMILGGEAIKRAVSSGEIGIAPFQKENVKDASYTFTLSSVIHIPRKASVVSLESGNTFDEITIDSTGFVLNPNMFVLGFSEEKLTLNKTFGCMLCARGSCAQMGLNILLSSTFAEPDTDGRITLEIHNASNSPILLVSGMKIVKGIFLPVE